MLLSVDWDAFSGPRELVFDAPIWGTRDRPEDRFEAWRLRAAKRGGGAWEALAEDFPLYAGWEALHAYVGVPTFLTLSHADAWDWLAAFPGEDVLNVDSHHDLVSWSGDPARVRPGNWAGLALRAGRARRYACLYPWWHAGLPVAEGYDLTRTRAELAAHVEGDWDGRAELRRQRDPADGWPDPAGVRALLLVQSPAWCSPAHDPVLFALARQLGARVLSPPLVRPAEGARLLDVALQ